MSLKTKFTKISNPTHYKWSQFFTAGDAWLESLEILLNDKDRTAWGLFYVIPSMVAFCIELYVKAIAAHEDDTFNGKLRSHRTSEILNDYADKIPLFKNILSDQSIIVLIKEYEKTIDVRFGEMIVVIEGEQQQKLINTIYVLREEACKRTGLR